MKTAHLAAIGLIRKCFKCGCPGLGLSLLILQSPNYNKQKIKVNFEVDISLCLFLSPYLSLKRNKSCLI